jgi:hypothetical protein
VTHESTGLPKTPRGFPWIRWLDDEHIVACQAMAVAGIVLRKVAEAIDVDAR